MSILFLSPDNSCPQNDKFVSTNACDADADSIQTYIRTRQDRRPKMFLFGANINNKAETVDIYLPLIAIYISF